MIIDAESLAELKQIYLEDTGRELSDKEALSMGHNLIEATRLVFTVETPIDIQYGESMGLSKVR